MRIEDTAFVSGFLRAFAVANAGVDYGPEYWFALVPQVGDAEESLVAYHESTRRHYEKIYPNAVLMPKMSVMQDWREHLPPLLNKWLFEGQFPPQFQDDQAGKKKWIVEQLEQQLLNSLEGVIVVWQLTIFFSEMEADDWLFQDECGLYHLHLGWSD